jgi:class 3 adenylate cyclase
VATASAATCSACANTSPPGARFCTSCGAALARGCASCGTALPEGARFCPSCGAAASTAAVTSKAPERTPRAYTPKHLADKILASRAALEGERKQVTVLFADLKNSTELSGAVDPEEWHGILDRFFAILSDGVHRFEGTVNQYTGDGIMALFGAPLAHEDHAQRACYAALQLQGALRAYATDVKRRSGLTLSARIGLNSGEVVVGKIGDDLRMDYTAQGQTVALAQRMEALASPDTIYLAPAIAALAAGYFALDDLGEFALKGVSAPLRVFELKGLGAAQTRFDRSRARGLSKFVGREKEMALLDDALARAIAGQGQVIGVVAEAGTGKSRLAFEFSERCRAKGIRVRTTTGVAHGKTLPLLPVLDYYRHSFEVEPGDSDFEARRKIAGAVVALDDSLVTSLPLLYDFLAVPDPERPLKMAPGPERQRALLALLKRLMLERSRRAPAVILFKDLHWIDDQTAVFLENLVDGAGASRTLLLVNFRPEFRAEWTSRSYYQQLTLAPLGASAFAEMLAPTLGDDPSLAGLAQRIHERTAGNPFFAEEIVQSLIESSALEGVRGRYRLANPAAPLAVPGPVQAVLAARIDRLPEREKRLLQTASVIGREFSRALLARVAELPDDELDAAVRALVQGEFLLETALYPDPAYAFKHPLTQEVALGSQLRDRRARVHAAVAKALIEIHAGKLDEQAALLAQHWEGAGDAAEAARWHAKVAERAGAVNAQEQLARWERVEALLAPLPETPESVALRAHALDGIVRGKARAYHPLAEIEPLYRAGLDLARRAGLRRTEALLHYGWYIAHVFHGSINDSATSALDAAKSIAAEESDSALTLMLASLVGADELPLRDRLAAADHAIGLARGDPSAGSELLQFSPLVMLLGSRVNLLTAAGRLRDAEVALKQGLELFASYVDPLAEISLRRRASELAIASGDVDKALSEATRAFELSRRTTHRNFAIQGYQAMLQAQLAAEDWDAAERTLTQWRAEGVPYAREDALNEARMRLARGDADGALALVDSERSHWAQMRITALLLHALLLHARALGKRDGPAAADAIAADLARVESLIDDSGAEGWRPRVHESRAELAELLGDRATRARELREAHRLYAAMGADGHAERLRRLIGD